MNEHITYEPSVVRPVAPIHGKLDSKVAQGTFNFAFGPTHEELHKTLAGFQYTLQKDQHFSCNITPFGLADVRATVDGTCIIYGLPADALANDTTPGKLMHLMNMAPADFKQLVVDQGFKAVLGPNSVIAIPPGYIVMTYATSAVQFVRWSTYVDGDKPKVQATIKKLLEAHPFLDGTDYKIFHDLITAIA
jgi:hypothetical protein